MPDLSEIPTEQLLALREQLAPSTAQDLSQIPTEQLLAMRQQIQPRESRGASGSFAPSAAQNYGNEAAIGILNLASVARNPIDILTEKLSSAAGDYLGLPEIPTPLQTAESFRAKTLGEPDYTQPESGNAYLGRFIRESPNIALGAEFGVIPSAVSVLGSVIGGQGAKDLGLGPTGEAVGSVLGAVGPSTAKAIVGKAGKYLERLGAGGKNSALGVTKADFKKSIRSDIGKSILKKEGETPLKAAIKRAENMGVLEGDKAPDEVYFRAVDKFKEKSSELGDLLKAADEAKEAPIKVDFRGVADDIKRYIEGPTAQEEALKYWQKRKSQLVGVFGKAENKGSILGLQRLKQSVQKEAYDPLSSSGKVKKAVDEIIASKLKKQVEKEVNNLALTEKISARLAGKIRSINQDLQAFRLLDEPLSRSVPGVEAGDLVKLGLGAVRTSGGAGQAIISGAAAGQPLISLGSLLGVLALNNPNVRYGLGSALEGAGSPLRALAEAVPTSNVGIAGGFGNYLRQPEQAGEEKPLQLPEIGLPVRDLAQSVPDQSVQFEDKPVKQDIKAIIQQEEPLVQAIIKVESAGKGFPLGNPRAVSPVGAQGLMQLMPAIQKAFNISDPFDPQENIRGGKALLEEELNRFKDLKTALAAYNAGSPAVKKAMKKAGSKDYQAIERFLPTETQKYVEKVLRAYEELISGAVEA